MLRGRLGNQTQERGVEKGLIVGLKVGARAFMHGVGPKPRA